MFEINVNIPLPHNNFKYKFQTKCITENIDNKIIEYYASNLNNIELCRSYLPNNVLSMHYFILSRIVSYINKNPNKEIKKNVLNQIFYYNELNIWIEEN